MVFQYTTDPINRQIVVGPLHPYYIYHCSVVAFTVQPGPYTAVFTIQTEEDSKCFWYTIKANGSLCGPIVYAN